MVMKRNKIILVILICVLIISIGVIAAFRLIDGQDSIGEDSPPSMSVENGGAELELTEEQYQLLKDSILHEEIEEMSDIRRINAWFILNAMREIEFVENRSPGESGVGSATWILDLLGVGEITELSVVRVTEGAHDLAGELIVRIVNTEGSTYYIWYNRTWGLGEVTKESEDGEMIYNSLMYTIIDGRICEPESPHGPAICD
jgi:hypothetical protein